MVRSFLELIQITTMLEYVAFFIRTQVILKYWNLLLQTGHSCIEDTSVYAL